MSACRDIWPLAGAALVVLLGVTPPAQGTPQFARMYNVQSCLVCHAAAPKLNEFGEAFLARGYRMPEADMPAITDVPVAVWMTMRQEEQISRDFGERYVNRVELISGGPIGQLPMSYFVEWRVISLETRADGTLRDRSGRFEDAFITLELAQRLDLTVGQFRALNQVDVSRRLSVSEPAAFSTSLPGKPTRNPRIQGLRAFAPAGRSPGVSLAYQSITGDLASDGLFHHVTIPFVGELSLPLTPEARREASFELRGPPKGVFVETYYRTGLNSVGGHGFIGEDRWLAMGVATARYQELYAAVAAGADVISGQGTRGRYSIELEYLPAWHHQWRPGLGFRAEQVTRFGRKPAYIPYFVLSGPNTQYTVLLQAEYRIQPENEAVFIDLSLLF